MKTAAEYLDAIKEAQGIVSDYGLAKRLGWSRPRISHYRSGMHHFDESGALQVAELLDLDPAEVLTAQARARWYRSQLRLESRAGLMLSALQA